MGGVDGGLGSNHYKYHSTKSHEAYLELSFKDRVYRYHTLEKFWEYNYEDGWTKVTSIEELNRLNNIKRELLKLFGIKNI